MNKAPKDRTAEIRRQLSRRFGRRGHGKFVAVDRKSATYLVADSLDDLLAAIYASLCMWLIGYGYLYWLSDGGIKHLVN